MFKVAGYDVPDKVKTEVAKASKDKSKKTKPSALSSENLQDIVKQFDSNTSRSDLPKSEPKSEKRQQPEAAEPSRTKKSRKSKGKAVDTQETQDPRSGPEPAKHSQKPQSNASEPVKNAVKNVKPAGKPAAPQPKLTPMQLKMQQKLSGARFRWINEKLYTSDSHTALELFTESPGMFKEYHDGFRHQVTSWPENPVDSMVKNFKERLQKPLNAPGGLPSSPDGVVTVADMGSGEAMLALQLSKVKGGPKSRRAKFTTHSFDLNKANDRITVADISNVPLPDNSVNVVVFCLALMGTNVEDFIKEGLRILKPHGEMWIAEIKSRFDVVDGKTDVTRFVKKLKDLSLHHRSTDDSNKMFVKFEFVNLPKKEKPKFIDAADDKPLLKPCIYKRR